MSNQSAPSQRKNNTIERYSPVLNKLFMNKLRGLIEEQYAFKNIDKTKKDLLQKYGVPTNSKIYNYKQAETRKISKKYSEIFPQQVKQDVNAINRTMLRGLSGVFIIGTAYYGGASYIKNFSRWGRLTSSGIFQKALVYCILLNSTNYFMLVRNSDEIELFFKHHTHYERAIDRYQQDLAM